MRKNPARLPLSVLVCSALTLLAPGAAAQAGTTATEAAQRAGVELRTVQANGIDIRLAEKGSGPLVLMLHGFPESWYSWRHQISALADAGYRAVAPDMRGYGGTDAPREAEAYDAIDLCGDVVGIIDALEEKKAYLVGHDWGAAVAWSCALLAPSRFHAVAAMSVPWGGRGSSSPLENMRRRFGDRFFYMLYFQTPEAEAELDADPRGLLTRFLASPGTPRTPPTITDSAAAAGGLLGRIGVPTEAPEWLDEEDLDFYVAELERTGFRGGLNYYRNLHRSWELTPHLSGAQLPFPALFIAGEKDLVIAGRDAASIEAGLRRVAPDLRGVHLIPGAGHWIQQERSAEVNDLLLAFLAEVRGGRETGNERRAGRWGRLSPGAPAETEQFAFIVGEWDCKTRFAAPDGTFSEGTARWTGYFILDGWAIQDDWISQGPGGREFHGTNIRSFNPKARKWDNRWLPMGSLQWKYYASEQDGESMVMVGGEGEDPRGKFIDRNVFHDITADAWKWRKDRSYDGGETWNEGVGFIEARRLSGPGS